MVRLPPLMKLLTSFIMAPRFSSSLTAAKSLGAAEAHVWSARAADLLCALAGELAGG